MSKKSVANRERFEKVLAWAKEANIAVYGFKDASLIEHSFRNSPQEIICMAARDLFNRIENENRSIR